MCESLALVELCSVALLRMPKHWLHVEHMCSQLLPIETTAVLLLGSDVGLCQYLLVLCPMFSAHQGDQRSYAHASTVPSEYALIFE